MKNFIYTIAFAFAATVSVFAHNGEKNIPTNSTATVGLSAEEAALEAELSEELNLEVEQVMSELVAEQIINAVKVFDIDGNELQVQNGEVDFALIPANAELLMTDGTTQYYVVAQ